MFDVLFYEKESNTVTVDTALNMSYTTNDVYLSCDEKDTAQVTGLKIDLITGESVIFEMDEIQYDKLARVAFSTKSVDLTGAGVGMYCTEGCSFEVSCVKCYNGE